MAPAGSYRALRPALRAQRSLSVLSECRLVAAPKGGRDIERTVAAPEDAVSADDRALMLEFQESGRVAAFEELFHRHRLPLYRYLHRLSRSAEVAEETSQHSWFKVIEAARCARFVAAAHSSFKTWLYTLARNHYVDHYVRGHASSRTDSNVEELLVNTPDECPELDEQLHRQRIGSAIDRALALLPLEQREVVLLWAQGHELTAIAQIARVPWETIVSRKKYALAKLSAALAKVGVTQGDLHDR